MSFAYPEDLAVIADVAQSFALDNGAFSAWKKGKELDVVGYFEFNGILYICEADNEKETGNVLDLIHQNISCDDEDLSQRIAKTLRRRGREISSLWG